MASGPTVDAQSRRFLLAYGLLLAALAALERLMPHERAWWADDGQLWDHAFGSFFKTDRRPPLDIGIREPMPASFLAQLRYPFARLPSLRAGGARSPQ